MNETVTLLNSILAPGGLLLFFVATVLIVDGYGSRLFVDVVRKYGLLIALVVVSGTSALTLVYSEVFGFEPCGLCWMQRVFLYPQMFILALAVYYQHRTVVYYGLMLSVVGMLIALYQHYLQMGGSALVACSTAGGGCDRRILFEYGFVTFPLLSAIVFFFLICVYVYFLNVHFGTQEQSSVQ